MQECGFQNVLYPGEPHEQGILNYGAFADADEAVRTMNLTAESDPDYDHWLVELTKPYVHIHSVGEVVETAATCSQKGRVAYICECGKALLDCSFPMIPHSYSDNGSVVEPTCTEEGYTLHICDVCGQQIITDKVPETDHVTELVGVLEPTCLKRGYTGDLVCAVCGTVVEKGTSVKATGQHDWGNAEITKAPTADESGYVTLYCLNCNLKTVEEIPALGHIALEYVYYNEDQHRAECTCGEEYYYGNHKWDAGVVIKEPTADEEVFPKGTGYISDLGMTGPVRGVIGVEPQQSIEGFLGGLPGRYRAAEGPCKLQGAVFTLDDATGLCTAVERIDVR